MSNTLLQAEKKRYDAMRRYIAYARANPRIKGSVFKHLRCFPGNCNATSREFRYLQQRPEVVRENMGRLREYAAFIEAGSRKLRLALALPESDHLKGGESTKAYDNLISAIQKANNDLNLETKRLAKVMSGGSSNKDMKDMKGSDSGNDSEDEWYVGTVREARVY